MDFFSTWYLQEKPQQLICQYQHIACKGHRLRGQNETLEGLNRTATFLLKTGCLMLSKLARSLRVQLHPPSSFVAVFPAETSFFPFSLIATKAGVIINRVLECVCRCLLSLIRITIWFYGYWYNRNAYTEVSSLFPIVWPSRYSLPDSIQINKLIISCQYCWTPSYCNSNIVPGKNFLGFGLLMIESKMKMSQWFWMMNMYSRRHVKLIYKYSSLFFYFFLSRRVNEIPGPKEEQ